MCGCQDRPTVSLGFTSEKVPQGTHLCIIYTMEILKVHPQMVVNGAVVNNPFYIEPERYLDGKF